MSRRALARLTGFAGVVGAAACVEIATGPGGAASIRFVNVPSAIVVGDTLRDSNGAVTTLHAYAFNENGDTLKDAELRFTALPIVRDTTDSSKVVPIVVDSITGLTRALGPKMLAHRARVTVRLGDRLQLVDTVTLVSKPDSLGRAAVNGSATPSMTFLCYDSATSKTPPGSVGGLGNVMPLAVRLTADSNGSRVPVPSYFVRFEIVSPTAIPSVVIRGVSKPAVSILADITNDRASNTDTTDATGTATAYLRVIGAGLPPSGPFATDTFTVRVRASARRSVSDVVQSPILFDVLLTRDASSSAATGPACRK